MVRGRGVTYAHVGLQGYQNLFRKPTDMNERSQEGEVLGGGGIVHIRQFSTHSVVIGLGQQEIFPKKFFWFSGFFCKPFKN